MKPPIPLVTLLLGIAGCSYMHWSPDPPKGLRYEPGQQVQIWTKDTMVRWHAVVVTRDSISGIPYQLSTTCDSCRLTFPWTAVDSALTGHPGSRFLDVVGSIVLTVAFLWPDHR